MAVVVEDDGDLVQVLLKGSDEVGVVHLINIHLLAIKYPQILIRILFVSF